MKNWTDATLKEIRFEHEDTDEETIAVVLSVVDETATQRTLTVRIPQAIMMAFVEKMEAKE